MNPTFQIIHGYYIIVEEHHYLSIANQLLFQNFKFFTLLKFVKMNHYFLHCFFLNFNFIIITQSQDDF